MSYYTHHRQTDTCHYVYVDIPLYHSGDLVAYDTHHKHTNDPHHIRVDVRSEDSVKKNNSIFVKITNISIKLKSVCWQSSHRTWKGK